MELLRQFLSMDRTISFSTGRRGLKPRLPGWFCVRSNGKRNRSELWGSRVASQIYRRVMDMRNARINCRDEKAISFHAHLVGIARGLFARLRAVGCFDNRIGRITPPITSHPLMSYVARQHRDSPLLCLRARTRAVASRAIFIAPGLFRGLLPTNLLNRGGIFK